MSRLAKKYNVNVIGGFIIERYTGSDPENRVDGCPSGERILFGGHEGDLLTADLDLSIIDKTKDFYREVEDARKKI